MGEIWDSTRTFIVDFWIWMRGLTDTIRIVNSNICNLDINDCVDKLNKPNKIDKMDILDGMEELLVFLKKVGQPNIYTLQEVDKGFRRTKQRDVAKDIEEALEGGVFGGDLDGVWKAYENIHKPWQFSKNDGVSGNALISNLNLDDHFEWDLTSHCPSMTKDRYRNAVGVYLSELSLPMWVITLHLSPFGEEMVWQLKNLLFRLCTLRNNDLVLVVGDFNIHTTKMVSLFNVMKKDFECLGYEHLKEAANDHVFLRDARKQLVEKIVETKDPIWEINGKKVYVTDHRLFTIDLSWPRRQEVFNVFK